MTSADRRAGRGRESRLVRYVPALSWVPRYQAGWLRGDAVAGFTIWGLLIPEGIAYATLAGLPPQAGLYTLLASLVLYAAFGTSRQLVVAGTSASAVLVASSVGALHPKDAAAYGSLAVALIVLTGLLFVGCGLLRLGFVTQFLSRPVMEGFVFGLAIFIAVGQLPKLLGLSKGSGDTIEQLGHLLTHLGGASLTTFAVGAVALVALFALDRVKRVPGGLVVLVAAIAFSAALHLDRHGVDTVGKIPAGLPSLHGLNVSVSQLWVLLPSAAGLMLVIFSEALGAADTFAEKYGYRIDPSQEMIAFGLANLGSGFLGGLAVGGSLSQSAVNDGAGARSEASPAIAAVLSLVTVIALTPLFTDLPEAVLAAMIIHAVSHLMKVGQMRRFYRVVPREFWLGVITLVAVITLDVLPALIIGMVVSLLVLVYRASRPVFSVMGASRDAPGGYEDVRRHPTARPAPGVLVIRPDAPLFYANAQPLRDAVQDLIGAPGTPVAALILDLDGTDDLDYTSAVAVSAIAADMRAKGVRFGLAHLHAKAAATLRRSAAAPAAEPGSQAAAALPAFATLDAAVTWARGGAVPRQADDKPSGQAADDPAGR